MVARLMLYEKQNQRHNGVPVISKQAMTPLHRQVRGVFLFDSLKGGFLQVVQEEEVTGNPLN
jgi:hypothetical protein